ncbi:hypothetical protein AB6A40_004902 [Gnathostoma spinigerum]|uniref:Uncharacterized protein n=1 Tax=Gnathostoma spinigerum TaxID=75299 RepID=A0ABD6EMK6_9BILA
MKRFLHTILRFEVRGPDASAFLNYVLSNVAPPLGCMKSSLMLTRKGNILGSFKVFHHDQHRSEFILLTYPEREDRDLCWLDRAAAELKMKVEIALVSVYLASLALVGPNSRDVLQELTVSDVSDKGFPQRTTRLMRIETVPVIAARTSTSTGQLSYELFHNRADTLKLYNSLMASGKNYGLVNFGQAAMNIMRLEHGFKLWGRELTLNTNPYEAGLGDLVDLSKKDFIGKTSAIELSKVKEWSRKQVLVACDPLTDLSKTSAVPKGMEVIRKEGSEERIGQVTSGTYSVRMHQPLCYAWVNSDVTVSDKLYLDVGGTRIGARVLEEAPFPNKG